MRQLYFMHLLLPPVHRLDLPLWEKLLGATVKNGRFQLRRLSGGKQDDITVLVAKVVLHPAGNKGGTVGQGS